MNIDDIEQTKEQELMEYRIDLMQTVKNRILADHQDDSISFDSIYAPNLDVDSTKLLLKKSFHSKISSFNDVVEIKIFYYGRPGFYFIILNE